MTSSRRPRRSAAQWQQLVTQQATSGLTASTFCDRHDLSYASFIQWRRRLRQGEPPVAVRPTAALEEPLSKQSMSFIELTAPSELCGRSERWLIELDLGSGMQLRIAQPR
jgi:transposase-like protein